jgi:hypothetical protein
MSSGMPEEQQHQQQRQEHRDVVYVQLELRVARCGKSGLNKCWSCGQLLKHHQYMQGCSLVGSGRQAHQLQPTSQVHLAPHR